MFKKKINNRSKNAKPFLLLLLFLISCFLQISITLKYAEFDHQGNYKVVKGNAFEVPDTPENPEKNNCDYFEEDNEITKVEGGASEQYFHFISKINLELRFLNEIICSSNIYRTSKSIYLSVCNLRI